MECNFSDAGINGFGFETVGITHALLRALVRIGGQGVGAFEFHGLVKEKAVSFRKGFVAIMFKQLQDGADKVRIVLVGHIFVSFCLCFVHLTEEQNLARLSKIFVPWAIQLVPPSLRSGSTALNGPKTNLQKDCYTPFLFGKKSWRSLTQSSSLI